MVLVKR
jgi:hypothetical protein